MTNVDNENWDLTTILQTLIRDIINSFMLTNLKF